MQYKDAIDFKLLKEKKLNHEDDSIEIFEKSVII
jgi:hypothetical protein